MTRKGDYQWTPSRTFAVLRVVSVARAEHDLVPARDGGAAPGLLDRLAGRGLVAAGVVVGRLVGLVELGLGRGVEVGLDRSLGTERRGLLGVVVGDGRLRVVADQLDGVVAE